MQAQGWGVLPRLTLVAALPLAVTLLPFDPLTDSAALEFGRSATLLFATDAVTRWLAYAGVLAALPEPPVAGEDASATPPVAR
ncbi:MAG: hypothetical protein EXR66_05160 [Dehalococcoidia bacterium]|nr:hypothetical protein [Dehalococcoidia bacterium]